MSQEDGHDDIPALPANELDQGILPAQIAILVNRRRGVSLLMCVLRSAGLCYDRHAGVN